MFGGTRGGWLVARANERSASRVTVALEVRRPYRAQTQARDDALGDVDRGDIAVADRRERHDREIEREDVPAKICRVPSRSSAYISRDDARRVTRVDGFPTTTTAQRSSRRRRHMQPGLDGGSPTTTSHGRVAAADSVPGCDGFTTRPRRATGDVAAAATPRQDSTAPPRHDEKKRA